MKRVVLSVVVVILVGALALAAAGCRGVPIEEIEVKTVKVGGSVPLSGPVAYWGICEMEAYTMAAEDINAMGGVKVGDDIYKIEMIHYDSKGTVADSRAATTRLVFDDGVKYVHAQAAASTIGTLEITEPNEVITQVACWGYLELTGPEYFYHFRFEMSDYEMGFAYMPFMLEYYGEDKLGSAFFIGPDDKDGYDCYYSYSRLMDYYGIENLGVEYYLWEITDFYPITTAALATNPDFIITSPTPPGITAGIVKAAREMGYEGPIVSPAALETKTILEVCGEFADDVVLPGTLEWPQTDYQRQLIKNFERRFGHFYALEGNYYWWLRALAAAWEAAGTVEDTTAVANALENVVLEETYVGKAYLGGEGLYGLNRHGLYTCYTAIIEDGEARLVDARFPELPMGY